MNAVPKWAISGNYFESCNCDLVCPCLFSTQAPMTSKPTEGDCHVALICHVDRGHYNEVALDGLNAALVVKSDGPMANGNMEFAVYVDDSADTKQEEALGAIFGGSVGGPVAAFAPLFGKNHGTRKAKITFTADGMTRSAEISDVLSMSVRGLASLVEGQAITAATGHPFNPENLALAVGGDRNVFSDHGMKWDNSGKNGHYAPINWSN